MRLPCVSVVVPARNEASFIGACLRSVVAQNYPRDLIDIVVVDNGSVDETVAIATELGARVVSKPNVLVGAVRNAGAHAARGEIVAFIDADCVAGRDWMSAAVSCLLSDRQVGAVGGGCIVGPTRTWLEEEAAPPVWRGCRDVEVLPGACFVIRKEVFVEIGGFSEQLSATEDDDLSRRLLAREYRLVKEEACNVEHLGYPSTIVGVIRRQFWIGGNQLDRPAWRSDRLVLTVHAFLLAVVGIALSLVFGQVRMMLLCVLVSVAVVFATAAFRLKKAGRPIVARLLVRQSGYQGAFLLGRAAGLSVNYIRMLGEADWLGNSLRRKGKRARGSGSSDL